MAPWSSKGWSLFALSVGRSGGTRNYYRPSRRVQGHLASSLLRNTLLRMLVRTSTVIRLWHAGALQEPRTLCAYAIALGLALRAQSHQAVIFVGVTNISTRSRRLLSLRAPLGRKRKPHGAKLTHASAQHPMQSRFECAYDPVHSRHPRAPECAPLHFPYPCVPHAPPRYYADVMWLARRECMWSQN